MIFTQENLRNTGMNLLWSGIGLIGVIGAAGVGNDAFERAAEIENWKGTLDRPELSLPVFYATEHTLHNVGSIVEWVTKLENASELAQNRTLGSFSYLVTAGAVALAGGNMTRLHE